MSFNRHVTRNFNANKTNRIRYDDDNFRCEILRFDKTYEQHYLPADIPKDKRPNADEGWFHGMKCLKSKYLKNQKLDYMLEVEFTYDAKTSSDNFRIELLFANIHKIKENGNPDLKLKADFLLLVNGNPVYPSMTAIGTDVNFSRFYHYCSLKKGKNTIKYVMNPNVVFIGAVVKKFDIWEAKRHNNKDDKLTMIRATVEHTKDLSINTMTAEFMYYHGLDEKLLPTDPDANRSGLVFDYRDEINLYVKNTEGIEDLVFGGYISTVEISDDDMTKVTMKCADRLIDLDRRYCLSEVTINKAGTEKDILYSGCYDYKKNYNNYSSPLKFLMNNSEVYLNTNISVAKPLVKNRTLKLARYRKGGYKKYTSDNMSVTENKNSITIRNGADTLKPQACVVYDSLMTGESIDLRVFPNLFFHYGLGKEKWEEKVVEYNTVEIESNVSKAMKKWVDRANKITKATGTDCIKPIWKWVATKTARSSASGFYQGLETTWKKKKGNCCCRTELMLKLLQAKGLTDLKYVHCYKSPKVGHVFAKVNGFYVDPSTRQESRGWHNYIHGYGKITHVTDFPDKPF